MAFIDTQLYIHQMFSIKNFILAADLMKSISLLRYQEESKTLSLVSRVRIKHLNHSTCKKKTEQGVHVNVVNVMQGSLIHKKYTSMLLFSNICHISCFHHKMLMFSMYLY